MDMLFNLDPKLFPLGVVTGILIFSVIGFIKLRKENYTQQKERQKRLEEEFRVIFSNETEINKPKEEDIDYERLLFNNFKESKLRLDASIKAQNSRANFNLFCGVLIALIGITLLLWFIFSNDIAIQASLGVFKEQAIGVILNDSIMTFVQVFLPKLSVVIIIETMAFFFLRLYSSSLNNIQYLNNELTSVEHRIGAVQLALISKDKELISVCVGELIKFEKNKKDLDLKNFKTSFSPDVLVQILKAINKKD